MESNSISGGGVSLGLPSGARVLANRPQDAPHEDHALLEKWKRLYAETAGAADWQAVHRWEDDDYPIDAAEDVSRKLRVQDGDRVLEIGSATGRFLALVLSGVHTCVGLGLDHCEDVLRRGRDFLSGGPRISLVAAEASKLPVPSETFARVFSYSVFQCFPSQAYAALVLHEMIRACQPGGIVLVGDVFGVMEKPRRALKKIGVPTIVAEIVLWPFRPLWHLKQRTGSHGDGLQRRFFTRGFFRRIAKANGCLAEFLLQNIPRREHSKARFDVRIYKPPFDS